MTLSSDRGVIITHISDGTHRPFSGHVNVIGTDDKNVTITVEWRATVATLIDKDNTAITAEGHKIGLHVFSSSREWADKVDN